MIVVLLLRCDIASENATVYLLNYDVMGSGSGFFCCNYRVCDMNCISRQVDSKELKGSEMGMVRGSIIVSLIVLSFPSV